MSQLSRLAQMQEAVDSCDIKRIISIMRNNQDSTLVQERGSNALGDLAYEHRGQIVREGGISAVIDAISAHRWHARMAELGCRCIGNLAFNAANTAHIAAHGGISAVITAMVSHKGDRSVQSMGCGALANISTNATYAEWIAHDGGIGAIVCAMCMFKVQGLVCQISIDNTSQTPSKIDFLLAYGSSRRS
jgi:hypothetical protein